MHENIRSGARVVLDLMAEFESLPAHSKRHAELEERITHLDGWALDRRIETAVAHLNCPEGSRRIETLSGGEKRRVAVCRAIISRPDFLMLDEPTNHLDPESIEWVAEYLENFGGAFLVVTHDRYFLDRVVTRMVELSDGKFFSHDGNYTDYLMAKAERQAADATIEHKRQMFLKRELAWVRMGARAQPHASRRTASSVTTKTDRPGQAEYRGGGRTVHSAAAATGQTRGGIDQSGHGTGRAQPVSAASTLLLKNGQRIGVAGPERPRADDAFTENHHRRTGARTEGTVKTEALLTKFNYVDQARLQLREGPHRAG